VGRAQSREAASGWGRDQEYVVESSMIVLI
jgi:hypothetical protein